MEIIKNNEIDKALDESKFSDRVYLAGRLNRPQKGFEVVKTEPPEKPGAYEVGISEFNTFTCEKPHVHTFNDEYNYVVSGAVKVYLFNEKKEELLLPGDFFVIKTGETYIAKECAGMSTRPEDTES